MILVAPADENELKAVLRFALNHPGPIAVRYPRADVPESMGEAPPFVPGESRLMLPGRDATILAYGSTVSAAIDAAELLATDNLSIRVINARFAKPIDSRMLQTVIAADHPIITVEDHGVIGGFGAAVLEAAADLRLPTDRIVRLGIPADRLIPQGSRPGQLAECGIDAAGIAAAVQRELEQLRLDHVSRKHDGMVGRTTPSSSARPTVD
jgi:1-deoxy-D-xylulose-5-phosphate synthase